VRIDPAESPKKSGHSAGTVLAHARRMERFSTINSAIFLNFIVLIPLSVGAQDAPIEDTTETSDAIPAPAPTSTATPAPSGSYAPSVSPRAGHVVRVDGRDVVIDIGARDGLRSGDHIEASEEIEVSLDGEPAERQRRRVAVGEVVAVTDTRARVSLGVNEEIPEGAEMRVTDAEPTASIIGPARVPGVLDIVGTFAPFLALGDIGGGVMFDGSLTYHGRTPYFVRATLGPTGFTTISQGTRGYGSGTVTAGLDHRFLELGFGLGTMKYERSEYVCPPGGVGCDYVTDDQMRVAIAATTRLGTLDGLHVRFSTTLAVTSEAFELATIDAALQVPLTTGVWVIARGGSGLDSVGYSFGGASVRWLARGNGTAGSLFLTGGLEWTLTRDASSEDEYDNFVSGLAPVLGVEYRL
jgi:hypothetical protein